MGTGSGGGRNGQFGMGERGRREATETAQAHYERREELRERHHEVTDAELAAAEYVRRHGVELATAALEHARRHRAELAQFDAVPMWQPAIGKADRRIARAIALLAVRVAAKGVGTVEEALVIERAERDLLVLQAHAAKVKAAAKAAGGTGTEAETVAPTSPTSAGASCLGCSGVGGGCGECNGTGRVAA